jgi:hypothetical protein
MSTTCAVRAAMIDLYDGLMYWTASKCAYDDDG